MALVIKDNSKVAVMVESSEGTYETPASGADFVAVLADGLELSPSKELLERNVLTGSLGKATPRTGLKGVTASIGVEFKAGSTAGADPEYSPLLKGALGATRNRATAVTTKSSGNTASILQIEDADIADLQIGDIVVVKQSGAYHVSPISARDATGGAANVTLLIPHPSGDCADSVELAPFRTFYAANSGHPSLSVSKYVDDVITEKGIGCRVASMAMEGFATGGLASLKFGLEGMTFDRTVAAPGFTPSLDTSLPPVILNAKVYLDTTSIDINEIGFSMENTVGFATATNSASGKISGRISSRTISGTINPYKASDNVTNFTKFNNNTEFSLFGYAANPSGVTGEFNQVVAFYMPKCLFTEIGESDQDGVLQDALSFSAGRGSDGGTTEIYVGMS